MSLITLLPDNYVASPETVGLQQAFDFWAEKIRATRESLFEQLNVETATWGLSIWEQALRLPTDAAKPDGERRARIMGKLRGAGVATVEMLKNVAESFSNGEIEIIERAGEYRFEVKFVGTRGIPPKMDDIAAAIDEAKPAHLAYVFIFTYQTWDEFDAYNLKWSERDALNLTWDAFETYGKT